MNALATHAKSNSSMSERSSPACSRRNAMRVVSPAFCTFLRAIIRDAGQGSMPTTCSEGHLTSHLSTESAATPTPTSRKDASGASSRARSPSRRGAITLRRKAENPADTSPNACRISVSARAQPRSPGFPERSFAARKKSPRIPGEHRPQARRIGVKDHIARSEGVQNVVKLRFLVICGSREVPLCRAWSAMPIAASAARGASPPCPGARHPARIGLHADLSFPPDERLVRCPPCPRRKEGPFGECTGLCERCTGAAG